MGNLSADEDKLYTDFVKEIFDEIIVAGQISEPVVTHIAEKLMKGVQDGYGQMLSKIAYDTPDYKMMANLQKNVYQFAAAKNYQQVKELTGALVDGDNVRSFVEFRKEATTILGEYNKYLETEYSTAVAGGQMAGKWVGFQEGAEDMPYLQYETVGDGRVRDAHKQLDRVIKHIDSPFWKTYYPPNGWNCRCTVIQLPTKANETPDKNITYPDIPKLWQVNTAQQNIIFPEDSPYFIGMPKAIKQQAQELLPYENRYETIFKGKNGGYVNQHIDVDETKPDYKIVSKIAREKAAKGDIVHILPRLDNPNDTRRTATLAGAKYGKNPDLRINGEYVEVKAPESTKKVINRIHEGASQADKVIVSLPKPYNMSSKTAFKIFSEKEGLQEFELRFAGKYAAFKRGDYIK